MTTTRIAPRLTMIAAAVLGAGNAGARTSAAEAPRIEGPRVPAGRAVPLLTGPADA